MAEGPVQLELRTVGFDHAAEISLAGVGQVAQGDERLQGIVLVFGAGEAEGGFAEAELAKRARIRAAAS